jgi:hypothetical protein
MEMNEWELKILKVIVRFDKSRNLWVYLACSYIVLHLTQAGLFQSMVCPLIE